VAGGVATLSFNLVIPAKAGISDFALARHSREELYNSGAGQAGIQPFLLIVIPAKAGIQ
jgi:hypothetical protein